MATNYVESNSSGTSSAKESTITYVFLASRLYPFALSDAVSTDAQGQITKTEDRQLISLDVTTRLSNNWQGELSKYSITKGSEITDHLSIQNNKYTLEGYISDTPFEQHQAEFLSPERSGEFRAMNAIETLEKIFKEKSIFTLFSEYQQIDNAVITSIRFEQTSEMGILFTIDMEQVRFSYAETVSLNVSKSTKKSVASNKNGGGSTKSEASTSTSLEKYRKSVADNKNTNQAVNNSQN